MLSKGGKKQEREKENMAGRKEGEEEREALIRNERRQVSRQSPNDWIHLFLQLSVVPNTSDHADSGK